MAGVFSRKENVFKLYLNGKEVADRGRSGMQPMIRNRLQYGTGFRADIIALTNIKGFGMKGTQLAKILCTNDSTVSRILSDLRACRFLDQENERIGPTDPYPGMFISSKSLWNLCEMVDAVEFTSEKLKGATLENLNLRHDGFGTKVLEGLI